MSNEQKPDNQIASEIASEHYPVASLFHADLRRKIIKALEQKGATIEQIVEAIDKEIQWCNENPDKAFTVEYRKGFINGLIQAKYLIGAVNRVGR